ncbi:MAG: YdbH domain-containing protein [Pseudomonadota bacterium]
MSASANAMTEHSPRRRRGKRLRFVLIAIAILLSLILATTVWIWANRLSLIERQAITYLNSLGIEADLDIRSATGTDADIRGIRLSYDGEPFLQIERLQAAYQWRDLLNGDVERLDFAGLVASVTLDETGQIIDGWQPPSTGEGASAFPVRGIGVTDAEVRIVSPFGKATLTGSGDINAPDRLSFAGAIERSNLQHNGITLEAIGPFTLSRENGPYSIATDGLNVDVDHPSIALRGTTLDLSAQFDAVTRTASGEATLNGGAFDSDINLIGDIQRVTLQGAFTPDDFRGDMALSLNAVSLDDPERRRDIAQTLSLSPTLANIPIAQNFAPTLVAPIEGLLAGSDIDAELVVSVDNGRRELILTAPMQVQSPQNQATFTPVEGQPLYVYDPADGYYDIATKLALTQPVPLQFDPLQVRINSENGLSVGGIAAASGTLKTQRNWRTKTQENRSARLSPLSIAFDYQTPSADERQIIMTGQADYDGDVPGGYVTGMKAGGVLSTKLTSDVTQVAFVPDRRLIIDSLETPSDWVVENFEGRLARTSRLYSRRAQGDPQIAASLSGVTMTALRPETVEDEAASVDLSVDTMQASARLSPDAQNWSIDFDALSSKSETFPVPQMDLTLPNGAMDVILSADDRTAFQFSAPNSLLRTPDYVVRDMALTAEGTSEDFGLDYQDGRVRWIAETEGSLSLPDFPLSGSLRFVDESFTGTATTYFSQAPTTLINIAYRYAEGRGTADVVIDRLMFQPRGLQPQDLAPTLRGKIAQVRGPIDVRLGLSFGGDEPLSGQGTVSLNDLSLGTAPGPVSGLSGTVELTSLFPVVTAPDQRLTVREFNPGFPLEDGTVIYALVPEGVSIVEAIFPLGEGSVSFDPFLWTYGAPENRVILRISGVEVGEFLEDTADGQLKISGLLEGTIPVVVRGIDVLVEQGRLEVRDGGVIRYQGDDMAAAMPDEYSRQAIESLKNFQYDSLFLDLDGPLDGEVTLGVAFTGSNPDVLYGTAFQYDVSVEGELFNIARSFNPNALQQRALSVISGDGN